MRHRRRKKGRLRKNKSPPSLSSSLMKFGKKFARECQPEWRYYSLSYKELKQTLKHGGLPLPPNVLGVLPVQLDFDALLDESCSKLARFYKSKESWATQYMKVLNNNLEVLEKHRSPSQLNLAQMNIDAVDKNLKEKSIEIASNAHFKDYIYAIKSLRTFDTELSLLNDFLELNYTGIVKILKKSDKKKLESLKAEKMTEIEARLPFLASGGTLNSMLGVVKVMLAKALTMKPLLPNGWMQRKVYTIGCFDLFHRGHINILASLREFGNFVVCGIHDDKSYFALKQKNTIDDLQTRIDKVKPYVDQIYVIPSTDPLPFIKAATSQADIDSGMCCYARGDDMLEFPSREWVESVMPVHFLPRTESCSSSLIRVLYHDDSAETREKVAFSTTRYDGKPVDESGELIKGARKEDDTLTAGRY